MLGFERSLDSQFVADNSFLQKFRSVLEFLPHAEWLLDTSKSISDHSTVSSSLLLL
jgi:hypothetical protein